MSRFSSVCVCFVVSSILGVGVTLQLGPHRRKFPESFLSAFSPAVLAYFILREKRSSYLFPLVKYFNRILYTNELIASFE